VPAPVLEALRRNWWALVLRGTCAVAFGLFAWFSPRLTLLALLLGWGVFACLSGGAALASAFGRDGRGPRGFLLFEAGVSLLAGAVVLLYPRQAGMFFLYLLASWAILSGAIEIIVAYRLRKEIRGEFWLGFAGVLSLLFGIMLVLRPGVGALAMMWLIASYSVLFGIVLIAWGIHLRRLPFAGGRDSVALRVTATGGGQTRR
jgi:uncharacterized membrane protein HdeD (DUF308 family)